MVAQPQHQRRGAGVHGDGQDEPDGRGVDVPHERRASVLQGEGGGAVGGVRVTRVRQHAVGQTPESMS